MFKLDGRLNKGYFLRNCRDFQSGRSLLEMLVVLAVIAILTVAGLTGYSFAVARYREKATVKLVSEMGLRYKMNPIKPQEDNTVNVKSIFPGAERVDAVTIKTPDIDIGRVFITKTGETNSFAVVVNQITDGSCRETIENGAYDQILWDLEGDGSIDEYDSSEEYFSLGKDFLKNWDKLSESDKESLPDNLKNLTKSQIIARICQTKKGLGHIGTAGLIWGGDCPTTGHSYWYGGRCYHCAQNLDEDITGACCEKGTVNICGYCKCPNDGKCQEIKRNPNYGMCVECLTNSDCADRKDNKHVCETEKTNTCVECVVNADCPSGKRCKKNHTCEACDESLTVGGRKLFRWDATVEICQCNLSGLALGVECLVVEGEDCCEETHPASFCGDVNGSDHCTLCLGDKGAGTTYDCGDSTPLCQLSTAGSYKQCEACPAANTFGAACTLRGGCNCDASKGLTCDGTSGQCKCANPTHIWNVDEGRCTPCDRNYGQTGGAPCPTLANPVCSAGTCVPCAAPTPFYHEGLFKCVQCNLNDDCPEKEFCKTTDRSYTCNPCSTSTSPGVAFLVHTPNTTDRCECTDDLRQCCSDNCNQVQANMECSAGGNLLTCVPGCTQHPDCPENYYCTCSGRYYTLTPSRACPVAGGECEPCPEDKPLRPKNSSEYCKAGQVCNNCNLNDEDCPATCCRGCDYKNDPENCPVEKCCDPKTDPETCPDNPECTAETDPCLTNPNAASCQCDECHKYVPCQGCVSKCAEGEACVAYNKGTNTCGEAQCIPVLPKEELIQKIGTINGKTFYIPPAEAKYRMTHASADRFCAHYGMRLAPVMEACMKDFRYDSGHDCANFGADQRFLGRGYVYNFTDRGNAYDLRSWNTSSSGDFWLAERDGNNALRVTHSCGNNHETNVCANIYPLCIE